MYPVLTVQIEKYLHKKCGSVSNEQLAHRPLVLFSNSVTAHSCLLQGSVEIPASP
jgi:hypothetical protein